MPLFSERYGYTKPSKVLIRETMTKEIENAICSCYDLLETYFIKNCSCDNRYYEKMELYLWTKFLNERYQNFYTNFGRHMIVATEVISDQHQRWFSKLNMVELTAKWLSANGEKNYEIKSGAEVFITLINQEFKRLNYSYRIVNNEIVEITSEEEIKAIEEAIKGSDNNVKLHLQSALSLISKKPIGDYRNSIKESISAVEAVCREKTGKRTLGDAMKELANIGIVIPTTLERGFETLYGYTNNPETGIRHALMDNNGTYVPSSAEAIFMIVSCSSFINYLTAKQV